MNISRNKLYTYLINLGVVISSLVAGIYIISNENIVQGYELLYLLPFIFGVCFVVFISKPLIIDKSIFLWILLFLQL